MFGFLFMFIIEKFVHHHHSKKCEHHDHGHSHAYTLAPMNIIGEIIHNFIDGLVIAGAFAANLTLGISATISILLHELPQEIADMGVLLYSGMSKRKALLYNFFSAITALFGTIVGILLIDSIESFNSLIIPFATGNFLYIAASNLVPQLHRDCKLSDTFIHIFAIVFGISIIVLLILYGPAHGHG